VVTAKTIHLKNAQGYFEEHLCVATLDYDTTRFPGEWFGLGAQRLGFPEKWRGGISAAL